MKATTWLEYIAVFSGIASVYYSRIENILVYPVGLVNTIIYIWLSIKGHLFGEASVNLYYTIMSIYGWVLWVKKDAHQHHIVNIQFSSAKQWLQQILFFAFFYLVIFFILTYLKKSFAPGAIPWADAFASATAYAGMWLMAKKKSRKLVLVDSYKYCIHSFVLCKGLCFYERILFYSFINGILLTGRMDTKGQAYKE